ncbi:unnamed protein product [Orchesella dallaii]|uniref:Uncharacterized protein n=1 Tax=Orchesella dallaii TaxID=48710 RepID=A0ABP1Q342_9HEXA
MTSKVLKIFLSAFVLSIIDNGMIIWCVQSNREIERLQNKISRFLIYFDVSKFGKKERRNRGNRRIVTPYYRKYDLLTILERKRLLLLKFVYKFRNNEIFNSWFIRSASATDERPIFKPCLHKKMLYQQSVKWNAIKEWNLLLKNRSFNIKVDLKRANYVDKIKEFLIKDRKEIYIV